MLGTNIIASGSGPGNCVTHLGGRVMVDCGVPGKTVAPHISALEVVVITHWHSDHIGDKSGKNGRNGAGLRKIQEMRPSVLFVFGEWMQDVAKEMGLRNTKVLDMDKTYKFGDIYITLHEVSHNDPNCAVKIGTLAKPGKTLKERMFKVLHATDMGGLDHIKAENFDIYAVEMNYDEYTVQEHISDELSRTGFSHRERSLKDHYSVQKATKYITSQITDGWTAFAVYPLHISSVYKKMITERYTKEYDFSYLD